MFHAQDGVETPARNLKRMKAHLPAAVLMSATLVAASPTVDSFDALLNSGARILRVQTDSQGKLLAAGSFHEAGGGSRPGLVRLHENGSVDKRFNPGTGASGSVMAIAAAPDGGCYLGGRFSSFNGSPVWNLVRLRPDGLVDPSFAVESSPNGSVHTLLLTADGFLYAGGSFGKTGTTSRRYLARFTPEGEVDPSFVPALQRSAAIEAGIDTMILQPDGKLVIAGQFETDAGPARLARLNDDGTIDPAFDGNPGLLLYTTAIRVDGNGRLLLAGLATAENRGFVRRLLANGAEDARFQSPVFEGIVHDLLVLSDGGIIAAGRPLGSPGVTAVRLSPNGELDSNWMATADQPVFSLSLWGGGVVAGGGFSLIQDVPRDGLAILSDFTSLGFHGISATPSGQFRVMLKAQEGQTYAVQSSEDLSAWSDFSTNIATQAGLEVRDTGFMQNRQRFFRARLLSR